MSLNIATQASLAQPPSLTPQQTSLDMFTLLGFLVVVIVGIYFTLSFQNGAWSFKDRGLMVSVWCKLISW